ncbi:MAG: two-component system cell cycle sensor histidine kinase/response regulator CckA [Enterobacterales bacterium]|jgi:two-component system cell cycle sensor histidine kinase/response regulator CckA
MSKNKKILVMDDDDMILALVTSILEHHDYVTETAYNGDIACEKYQQAMNDESTFDLVIIDLTIPAGMGGEEAVLEILKIDPDAKCVVSSGYALDPIMTNFSDYGFKGAINKPFEVSELLATLTTIINN